MQLGERATTVIDEGEYAGAEAMVDQVIAYGLATLAGQRMLEYLNATDKGPELDALRAMAELYAASARPAWNLEDPRGPISPTAGNILLRVPVPLFTSLYELWVATYPVETPVETPPADGAED